MNKIKDEIISMLIEHSRIIYSAISDMAVFYSAWAQDYESNKETLEKKKNKMINITINIPECYDENIQKLIQMKIVPSRSEAIRTALRDFLHNEYKIVKLLGYFDSQDKDSFPGQEKNLTKK